MAPVVANGTLILGAVPELARLAMVKLVTETLRIAFQAVDLQDVQGGEIANPAIYIVKGLVVARLNLLDCRWGKDAQDLGRE